MDPAILFFVILAIVVMLGITVLVLILYSGLFTDVQVVVGASPFKRLRIYYKFQTGPYKDVTGLFTEAVNAAPGLRTIGIYYDDPRKVEPDDLRACIGAIVEEGGVAETADVPKHIETLQKHGFKELSLPPVGTIVFSSFPWHTNMSILLAIKKTYPQMNAFLEKRRLNAGPFVEIYDDGARPENPLRNRRNSDADDIVIDNNETPSSSSSSLTEPHSTATSSLRSINTNYGPGQARVLFWAPVPPCEDYFCPEAIQAAMDADERRRQQKISDDNNKRSNNGFDAGVDQNLVDDADIDSSAQRTHRAARHDVD